MRKWIGAVCVILGFLCLFSSVGFVIYNQWESKNAEKLTKSLLEDVKIVIEENTSRKDEVSDNVSEGTSKEMATVQVDGFECIGVLSIPVLDLELPVFTDWNYEKLKKAPCLYYGSYYEKDFVIAAHNYDAHFGRLSDLQAGDIVVFTDVNGEAYYYEVSLLETLPKNATQEMITSGFDLSLYTCTLSGGSRVTVRCSFAQGKQ